MTHYTIFQKIIELEVMQESQFPNLSTTYIPTVQTFLRRCLVNTTMDCQKLTNFLFAFLIFFLVHPALHT